MLTRLIYTALVAVLMVKPAQAWDRHVSISPVDDSKTVVLQQVAEAAHSGTLGFPVRARLVLRCMENTTSLHINVGIFLGLDATDVITRIDKEQAETRRWRISTDHKAMGLWNGGASIPYIRRLVGKTALFVRVTPYGERPVELLFNIEGLRDELPELAEACNWLIQPPPKQTRPSKPTSSPARTSSSLQSVLDGLNKARGADTRPAPTIQPTKMAVHLQACSGWPTDGWPAHPIELDLTLDGTGNVRSARSVYTGRHSIDYDPVYRSAADEAARLLQSPGCSALPQELAASVGREARVTLAR
mgnify:CR=1 FL=1